METAGKIPGFMHSASDASTRKQPETILQIQRDLGFALASERSLDGALQISLRAVIEIDGIDCGSIYLKEKNGPRLRLRAHEHLSAKFVKETDIFEADSAEWELFMAGRPVYLHSHGFNDPSLKEEGIKAFALIPIFNEGMPIAFFNVASRKLDDLPPLSRTALVEISTQIGGIIARIDAMDKLRESVNRYRLLADNTTDIISRHIPGGIFQDISPSCRVVLGYEPEELAGIDPALIAHPDDLEALMEFDNRLSHAPFEGSIRHRARRKDGTYVWLETIGRGFQPDSTKADVEFVVTSRDISDKKRIEEALKKSESKYRTLFNSNSDAIFVHEIEDGTSRMLEVNDTICRMTGYPREELLKMAPGDIIAESFHEKFPELKKKLFETGHLLFEAPIISKDGGIIPAETSSHLIELDSRSVVLTVCRDITERKRHEEELREARANLERRVEERTNALSEAVAALKLERDRTQTYLDVSGVMILTLDSDGRITAINKKGCEIVEADESEIIGKIWIDNFLPEDLRGKVWHIFREIASGNLEPFESIESDLLTAKGNRKTIAWKNSVIRDADGHIVGTLSSGADVTQRKQAEAQLQKSQELLQTIFDGISDPLMMMDRNMRIKMLNQAAFAYYDVDSAPDIIGTECYKSVRGKKAPCDGCEIAARLSSEIPHTYTRKSPFAEGRFEQIDIFPLPGDSGEINGMVVHISDITEKKQMDEQLMRADRLSSLGQLTGGIAHEIRNPLTGIRLFIDILSDPARFSLSAQQEELYEEITENVKKIEEIIHRALDLARPSEPNQVKIDVNKLIRRSMQLWNSRINKSQIRLTLDLYDTSLSIIGDKIQLQQVLNNMVANALDAMEKGGDLKIVTRAGRAALHNNRPVVKIIISDTGTGIPEGQVQNIFNPFFTTKSTGTGLGLAISHKIVEQHGGLITCENGDDGGAEFTIEFPKPGDNV